MHKVLHATGKTAAVCVKPSQSGRERHSLDAEVRQCVYALEITLEPGASRRNQEIIRAKPVCNSDKAFASSR